jgi:hypothetical protein
MHRFQSQSTITRFKFSALLICLKYLMVPGTGGLLVYSLAENDRQLTFIAIALGAGTLLMIGLQWVIAQRTRCPLCLTPVMANKGCSKHRNAKTVLGSHRLRVALAIIFRGSFVCPYCHEPSAMEVRTKRPESRTRKY